MPEIFIPFLSEFPELRFVVLNISTRMIRFLNIWNQHEKQKTNQQNKKSITTFGLELDPTSYSRYKLLVLSGGEQELQLTYLRCNTLSQLLSIVISEHIS